MELHTLRRAVVALLAGMSVAGGASALTWVSSVPQDTVTDLYINWDWDTAGGTGIYPGAFWNAELDATFAGGMWVVTGKYQHLAGPHGEGPEGAWHTATTSFMPGSGAAAGGVEDHLPPDLHIDFHHWLLAANGPPPDPALPFPPPGFARQEVQHPIPEPATWFMMAAGLAGLAGWRRYRGRPS